jgi:agmatinase
MPNKNHKTRLKFCDIEERYSSWKNSRIAVLPVSYDLTTSYKPGAARGPKAIIDASRYMETYDEETEKEIYKLGIYTSKEIRPDSSGPEKIIKKVENQISRILKAGKFPVVLGGEHSITLGPVRALIRIFQSCSWMRTWT